MGKMQGCGFEVCIAANEWGNKKKLRRVLTLLKGHAWAVYNALTDAESVDELTQDLKKLLNKASPNLPAVVKSTVTFSPN